jgi:hypothetical protein
LISNASNLFASKDSLLYKISNTNVASVFYEGIYKIQDVDFANATFYIGEFEKTGQVRKLDANGNVIATIKGMAAFDVAADSQGELWVANDINGWTRISTDNTPQNYAIEGPFRADCYNIKYLNNQLYMCAGGQSNATNGSNNRGGVSYVDAKDNWKHINQFENYPQMDSIIDIIDVEVDKRNGTTYLASFGGGLIEIKKSGSFTQYARNSGIIEGASGGTFAWLVNSLKMDAQNNLWVSVSNAASNNVVVKKADGSWKTFSIPTSGEYKTFGQIEIDDVNQKWIVLPNNRGLLLLNDNQSIDNTNDDRTMVYTSNSGNLASNNVRCITKDKDGKIWVGTDNGISVINCPENALLSGGCPAENKIVQYDNVAADYLFKSQLISTIAVDGANRKWVGTGGNGVWLISDDAEKIIQRFDKNNSPLPSDEITKIEVNPISGEVYIATSNGLVSYRGTAIDGITEQQSPIVFPNPVEPNYTGTIAISGLIANADVRIIDMAGQLVYRTKALGGQAIWNGKTYTGQVPQSGVYYVLATNADGSFTQKTSFVFMHSK